MDRSEQIARLLDKDEIRDRKLAFARAADACDTDRMVEHFAKEGFVATYDPLNLDDEPVRGREVIRAWYDERHGSVIASSHHLSNIEITFSDPDTATLRCYIYSWQRFAEHPPMPDRHRFARYLDTWIRTDEGWKQQTLTCYIAGEYGSYDPPRLGEYFEWDK